MLLRKSDSLSGACRNHLENLKEYLNQSNQTQFSNSEIRRNLRVKETTLRRYNTQLLLENYIRKVKNKVGKSNCYEVVNIDEYKDLKDLINKALQDCMTQIQLANSPQTNLTQKTKSIKTKSTS
ncbi:hypothetical protein V3470_13975 [Flavobacterium oreochromis]|uniref:HTH domain-containing protein n=1 Tax=Flavobacterium oreochromis TaxID=2906078 RepID=A0ABW8P571_9FLAO|nr:hypothetical protein [Flavobacterium oreochromis]